MQKFTIIRSDLLLLLTAILWGFAFVAQRMGMEYIGPFLFNAIRFLLGAGVMWMVLIYRGKGRGEEEKGRKGEEEKRRRGEGEKRSDGVGGETERSKNAGFRLVAIRGLFLGLILFAGATFQQVGIVYTTAGNAGFITGLYVIFVPLFGTLSNQKAGINAWGGAILAVIGMYFLSVTAGFTISKGDFLVLLSAVFWAIHVLYTGWLSPQHSAIRLALVQYLVVSVMSFVAAFFFESNTFSGVWQAVWPILYGGVLSVGIGYTLQIVGQKKAPPAHAAIIMSLEAVFALIGGMIILSETMTERKWIGCTFMLAGMLLAQVKWRRV
jgi:drug/metabolite transporter (DMT)-like permease